MKPGPPKRVKRQAPENGAINAVHDQLRRLDPDKHMQALTYANRIAIHLAYGNRQAAHDLVDIGLAEMRRVEPLDPLLDTEMAELVSMRITNLLATRGITTVKEMLQAKVEDLRTIHNFGDLCIVECFRAVAERCVKLNQKEHPNGK